MVRLPKVVAIVAAYNESDVIGEVIAGLIDGDVQVYFLDHHSTDDTMAQVEAFLGRGVIGVETFPSEQVADDTAGRYTWEHILRRKEQLALEIDADWFIHHDADEFRESPWSGETLRQGIGRVDAAGYNAIDFQVLNFWPTTADPEERGDIRDRLLFYERGRHFDRQQIKCWKATGQSVALAPSGGHSVHFSGRRIFPIRFLLRHYPIRSQAHGQRKVFRDRVPRFDAGERARGWHIQYDEFKEGVSFVRDPASLRRYEPEAIRLDLLVRNREVERLERAIMAPADPSTEVTGLARLEFPVSGSLELSSDVRGFWRDRWCGTVVTFRAAVAQSTSTLRIVGTIPADLAGGQDFKLGIDGHESTYHAGPGAFEWTITVALEAHADTQFAILAARSWNPSDSVEADDCRDLAWQVLDISAG